MAGLGTGLYLMMSRQGGGSGPYLPSIAEFKPEEAFSPEATLVYGGTPIDVALKITSEGPLVRFTLTAHDQALETETYRMEGDKFYFVSVDESFEPPILLLKFPMNVGETWDWAGSHTAGSTHQAKATVKSTAEPLFLEGLGQLDTVRVDVGLSIDSGTTNPASRKLSFWFVKGRGIVQREFGAGVLRRPRGAVKAKPAPGGS